MCSPWWNYYHSLKGNPRIISNSFTMAFLLPSMLPLKLKTSQILYNSGLYGNIGGERGIRTPGGFHLNGFQDRRIRPLCHLSGAKVMFESIQPKNISEVKFRVVSVVVLSGLRDPNR